MELTMMRNYRIYFLIIFAIFIGAFFCVSNAAWVFLLLFCCLYIIFRYLKTSCEPKIIFKFILIATIIRILLAIFHNLIAHKFAVRTVFDFAGDAAVFTSYGVYIAEILTGKEIFRIPIVLVRHRELLGSIPMWSHYQVSGMAYLHAIIFSAFGYSALWIKLFNSLIGVLIGFMAYCFLRKRAGFYASALALFLILFFPSLLVWSVTGLKDIIMIFVSFLFVLSLGKFLNGEMKFKNAMLMVLILGALFMFVETLRSDMPYLYYTILFFSLFITLFFKLTKFYKMVVVLGITLFILYLNPVDLIKKGSNEIYGHCITYQRAQYLEYGRTGYKIYPERFYSIPVRDVEALINTNPILIVESLFSFIKAITYYVFSPLPSDLNLSNKLILVYPQALVTLLLFPFMLIGSIHALRSQPLLFMPMFSFMVLFWIIGGHLSGNIGTAFRQKDLIMPIYLTFSSIGIALVFGKKGD